VPLATGRVVVETCKCGNVMRRVVHGMRCSRGPWRAPSRRARAKRQLSFILLITRRVTPISIAVGDVQRGTDLPVPSKPNKLVPSRRSRRAMWRVSAEAMAQPFDRRRHRSHHAMSRMLQFIHPVESRLHAAGKRLSRGRGVVDARHRSRAAMVSCHGHVVVLEEDPRDGDPRMPGERSRSGICPCHG